MDEKVAVLTLKKTSRNYYRYEYIGKEVIGRIYIAKDIIEVAPEKIQIVIRENKE